MEFVRKIGKRKGEIQRYSKWDYDCACKPPDERARLRSKTFPGIAKAMAEQWGILTEPVKDIAFRQLDLFGGTE